MTNGKRVLTAAQRRQLRAACDSAGGAIPLAALVGVGKDPVTRALAGLPVRAGTLIAIEAFLAKAEGTST